MEIEAGDQVTVNGRNVLRFDASLSYGTKTVRGAGIAGGGLFNSVFTGYGRLGLACEGDPLVIPVSQRYPVFVDTDAVVGRTARLRTSLHRSQSIGSMPRGGSGEAVHGRGRPAAGSEQGDGRALSRRTQVCSRLPGHDGTPVTRSPS